jgi:hypothetical protein
MESVRWGWVVNATHWPLYTRERDPVPIALKTDGKPIGRSVSGREDNIKIHLK